MKFKGFMGTAVLVGLMVFGCSTMKVNAIEQEQVEVIEENKSGLAEWLDEDLTELILNIGATATGAALTMLAFLRSINDLKAKFKKSSEDNTDATKTLKSCEKEILDNNLATKVAIEQNNKETLEKIIENNAITREEIEKLLKVFAIAFSNDSKLVKNGAANEIMKVLGGNDENTEA